MTWDINTAKNMWRDSDTYVLGFLSCDISRLDCYPLNTLCIFWGWLWSQVTQRPHIWYWPDFGDQTDSIVVITCKIKCYETSNLKTFHRTQFIYSSIQASTGCWGVKKEHFGADFDPKCRSGVSTFDTDQTLDTDRRQHRRHHRQDYWN